MTVTHLLLDAIQALWRFLGNLLLALALGMLTIVSLAAGFGLVLPRVWETYGLDYEAEGGNWTWIEGQPIYMRVWEAPPDSPAVVLVHGYQIAASEIWQENGESLARWGVRPIAVDLKGWGRSVRDATPTYSIRRQAELLAKVMNQHYIQDAILVGHGWGGAVALQVALDQPQFVGRLVLIAPQVYEAPTFPWQPAARIPLLSRTLSWAMSSGGPSWRRLEERAFFDPFKAPSGYWKRAQRLSHIVGTLDSLHAMAISPPDSDIPQLLGDIRVPVLILWGEGDALVSRESVERLARDLPDARLVVIPKAGHYVQMEQAARLNRAIARFALEGER